MIKHPAAALGIGVPSAAALITAIKATKTGVAPRSVFNPLGLALLPMARGAKTNAYIHPFKVYKNRQVKYNPNPPAKVGDWKSLPFHTRLARTVGPGLTKASNMLFGAVAGHMPLVWYNKWMEPQPHYNSPGSVGRQRYADLRHLRYSLWDQENLAN